MFLTKLFQLIGLCPTSLNYRNYQENVTLILSIHSLLQCGSIIELTVYSINFKNDKFLKTSSANAWTVSLEQLASVTSHSVILIESLIYRPLFLEIPVRIFKAKTLLNIKTERNSWKEKFFWIGVLIFGVLLRLKIVFSFIDDSVLFKYTIFILPSNLLSFFRIVQISYYLYQVQLALEVIEDETKTLQKLSEYNRIVQNQEIVCVESLASKVDNLRNGYHQLCQAINAINRFCGHGLLANILRIFVEVICNCFWIYSSIYNNDFDQVDG